MPKPNNGGGGDGGLAWRGGRGDDTAIVLSADALAATTYDGRAGSDTLDLSALTAGVTIKLNNYSGGDSILYPHRSFTGFYTEHSLGSTDSLRLTGTLKGIENLIGTSGDDSLQISGGTAPSLIDGGAGNDMVGGGGPGSVLIGGAGSDVIIGSNSLLIGGTYDNGIAPGDGESDLFEANGGAIILDFELGLDRLIMPAIDAANVEAMLATDWTTTSYEGVESALFTSGTYTVTLVGITAAEANATDFGLFVAHSGTVAGGPGDDILRNFDGGDSFLFGSGAGDDVVSHFDPAEDVLLFPDGAPAAWAEVSVNGTVALQGVYDDGQSSVTLLGLTAADADDLMFG